MSSIPVAIDQRESPRAFLDEAYKSLGYEEGTLLNATICPDAKTDEEWLDKGDWLALAYKVGAEKVFFVKNDPVLVFCELQNGSENEQILLEKFRRVWCMSRPQFLFIALPGELRLYRLDRPPTREVEVLREKQQIALVKSVADVAKKFQDYRRVEVESGRLFSDDRFGGIDQRADRQLIQDLKTVRKQLLVVTLERSGTIPIRRTIMTGPSALPNCPNPQCSQSHVIGNGSSKGRRRYQCRGCGRFCGRNRRHADVWSAHARSLGGQGPVDRHAPRKSTGCRRDHGPQG